MYLIFRPGARIAERLTTLALIVLLFFSIYGFFISFIPSDDYIPIAVMTAFFLGSFLILPFILWWGINKSTQGRLTKLISYFLIYLALTGIGFVVTISSFPYVITLAIGKSHEEPARVRSKSTSMKRCSYELFINHNKSVLCISRDVWEKINKGDAVILQGKLSALGFSVTNVEKKLPKNARILTEHAEFK